MAHEHAALAPTGPNADQIERWNETSGVKWARHAAMIEPFMKPISDRLLERAAAEPGQAILDIGCGAGAVSLTLAEQVGSAGRVLGVDISAPMLGVARTAAGAAPATFVLADASEYALPPAAFDLAISRFGVMFFADPVAAFANIRKGLKSGGRLVFVCWQSLKFNAWVTVPLTAALKHLPPPEPLEPGAPGPFAFADAARLEDILKRAGYQDIAIDPVTFSIPIAGPGPDCVDRAAFFVTEIGPVSSLLDTADEASRAAVHAEIREAMRPYATANGVLLDAACWLVEARA